MTKLYQMKCVACRGDEPKLTDNEIAELQPDVPEWEMIETDGIKRLERTFNGKGSKFSGAPQKYKMRN